MRVWLFSVLVDDARGGPARADPLGELTLILLLSALAALPAIAAPILPLIDLGGHIARYAVQLDAGRSPVLANWYSFEWGLLPNLGVDLLVQLLGPIIGLEPAVHLIVGSIPPLTVSGMLLLSRAAHGRIGVNALYALPLAISLPYLYGFANFALSIALAFHAMALWIALERRPVLRTALFVPIGFLLWLCHLVGWAVFSLVAGMTAPAAGWRSGKGQGAKGVVRMVLTTGLMTAPLLLGPLIGALQPKEGAEAVALLANNDAPRKIVWLIMAMADHWLVWDAAGAAVIAFVVYISLRTRGFVVQAGLMLAALALLGLFLLMPDTIMGSRFADMRLGPVILALFVLASAPGPLVDPRLTRWLLIGGLVFGGARLATNTASMAMAGNQYAETLTAIEAAPRGANLVSLYVDECKGWSTDRRRHIMGYGLVRRHLFDNGQWQLPSGQLIAIHNPRLAPFDRDPSTITFLEPCGESPGLAATVAAIPRAARYLWVIRVDTRTALPGWEPLRKTADSVLYRRLPTQLD
ncbi:MAG: GtrA family protein [Novosphingobium sp.]|uniref:GtrA family protein n=1 Tax=Novosphingobium sp. TaxID=1874826 RepID=UPI0030163828